MGIPAPPSEKKQQICIVLFVGIDYKQLLVKHAYECGFTSYDLRYQTIENEASPSMRISLLPIFAALYICVLNNTNINNRNCNKFYLHI